MAFRVGSIVDWRTAVNAVTATTSRAVDAVPPTVIAVAAASYVPPRPEPQPLDYVGVVTDCGCGLIEQITAPSTLTELTAARDKLISASDGAKSMTIVTADVGKLLTVGQLVSKILDVMEKAQSRGYEILGYYSRQPFLTERHGPGHRVSPTPVRNDRDRSPPDITNPAQPRPSIAHGGRTIGPRIIGLSLYLLWY
jgi:hypothetical protein